MASLQQPLQCHLGRQVDVGDAPRRSTLAAEPALLILGPVEDGRRAAQQQHQVALRALKPIVQCAVTSSRAPACPTTGVG